MARCEAIPAFAGTPASRRASARRKRLVWGADAPLLDGPVKPGDEVFYLAKRFCDLARAFAASISRSRGWASDFSEKTNRRAASVTSSTACRKAASFAFDGALYPLNFRTNCNADAPISSSVAGGSKLKSVRMFLHIESFPY